ncbi:MAG: hypothetical protein QM619_07715 [Micropruina sp.]|uniref:preprotein translocase subunit SecA n=1 Tax=Micropruina sp. TaxID=2737536 RepID=UPI0039E28B07
MEAKEHLEPGSGVDVLDQLLVRDLIGLYEPVVGMSATLVTAAGEIADLYDLPVGGLPAHRPCIRVDEPDRLYDTAAERDVAAIDLVAEAQMAGRGIDIRLAAGVAELGGLLIVGLGRFPSRRLDDQLRGRAGRQGDPGRAVFLTSLDDLILGYAPEHPPARDVADDGTVFDRKLLRWMDHAQRVADGQRHSLRDLAHRYGGLLAIHRDRERAGG